MSSCARFDFMCIMCIRQHCRNCPCIATTKPGRHDQDRCDDALGEAWCISVLTGMGLLSMRHGTGALAALVMGDVRWSRARLAQDHGIMECDHCVQGLGQPLTNGVSLRVRTGARLQVPSLPACLHPPHSRPRPLHLRTGQGSQSMSSWSHRHPGQRHPSDLPSSLLHTQ